MLRANIYFAPLELYCYRQINNYKHIALPAAAACLERSQTGQAGPLGLQVLLYRIGFLKLRRSGIFIVKITRVIQKAPAERHIKGALRNISY
jgi:hypothetical protein